MKTEFKSFNHVSWYAPVCYCAYSCKNFCKTSVFVNNVIVDHKKLSCILECNIDKRTPKLCAVVPAY